ncbi:MAG: GGDEF domain-containing protein [Rhizobacter sp.]|nr:GGDEF domain-containing protein [Rhizobacter sp.]
MSQLADRLADLTGFRDRDRLDASLASALRDLLRPQAVAIYRCVGEAGNERWITRARLNHDDAVAASDPGWVELESLPRLADFPQRRECFSRATMLSGVTGTGHRLLYPLATDQQVLGVLELETAAPMDEEARRLIDSILRIFSNFHGLLEYSERDTLTGLLNRKTFDDSFLKVTAEPVSDAKSAAEDRRAGAPGSTHWLGLIDIDHFKRVNDNFGHLIGDEVLLLLARLMRSGFRFYDRLYRFGGEEFVVLMRCDDGNAAAAAFERFRVMIESHVFPQVGRITVSVGFTEVGARDTPSAAFERADKAVYYAKDNGRNRVCGYADLVARGKLVDQAKVGDVELF